MSIRVEHLPPLAIEFDPLIAEAKRRARRRRGILAVVALIVGGALGMSFALRSPHGSVITTERSRSPIQVTLTAQNHRPIASHSPYAHWSYCVGVRTAAGKSVASKIHLQILSGSTSVAGVGLVWLKKGYDHWCAGIGGEASVLNAVPRGQKLDFQAVVRAENVTVKRDWPIVVG